MQKMMGGLSIVIERPGIAVGPTEKEFIKENKGFKYDITVLNDGNEDDFKRKTIEIISEFIK